MGQHRRSPRYIRVDLESLRALDHKCDAACGTVQCCCGTYDVCVTRQEMENIIGMMPAAARYCPQLAEHGGFRNVFEEVEPGLFSLETDEDGLCLFACTSGKRLQCSLHCAAVEAGMPLQAVKPESCLLWPLCLSEGEEPVLTVAEEALSFVCNRLREPDDNGHSLAREVLAILATVFGEKAAEEVNEAARKGWSQVKVRIG